jgi:hypothetical protein
MVLDADPTVQYAMASARNRSGGAITAGFAVTSCTILISTWLAPPHRQSGLFLPRRHSTAQTISTVPVYATGRTSFQDTGRARG